MPSRRRFLATAAAGASVGLAGCNALPNVGGGGGDVELVDDFPASVGVDDGWPSARRDPANTACLPDADPLPEPSVDWRTRMLPARARLTVGGATLVAGSATVFGFDVVSGEEVWSVDTGGDERASVPILDSLAFAPGAVRRTDIPRGYSLVDVTTGESAGAVELDVQPSTGPTFPRRGSDSLWFAPAGDGVIAWHRDDAEIAWRQDVFGDVYQPLAFDAGLVAAATSAGELYAFAAGGAEGWRTDFDDRITGPAVFGRNRVYVPLRSSVAAVGRHFGDDEWTADVQPTTDLALGGKRVFAGSNTELVALSAKTGAEAWRVDLGAQITAAPVVRGDSVSVGTSAGDGRVHSYSTDGSERWSVELGDIVGPALVTAGSHLYAMVRDADVRPHAVALA